MFLSVSSNSDRPSTRRAATLKKRPYFSECLARQVSAPPPTRTNQSVQKLEAAFKNSLKLISGPISGETPPQAEAATDAPIDWLLAPRLVWSRQLSERLNAMLRECTSSLLAVATPWASQPLEDPEKVALSSTRADAPQNMCVYICLVGFVTSLH